MKKKRRRTENMSKLKRRKNKQTRKWKQKIKKKESLKSTIGEV